MRSSSATRSRASGEQLHLLALHHGALVISGYTSSSQPYVRRGRSFTIEPLVAGIGLLIDGIDEQRSQMSGDPTRPQPWHCPPRERGQRRTSGEHLHAFRPVPLRVDPGQGAVPRRATRH
jgi:hypothetical protein